MLHSTAATSSLSLRKIFKFLFFYIIFLSILNSYCVNCFGDNEKVGEIGVAALAAAELKPDTKLVESKRDEDEQVAIKKKKRDSKDDEHEKKSHGDDDKKKKSKHEDDDDDDDKHKDSDSNEKKDSHEIDKAVAQQNIGFIHGFLASLSVVVVSEIGDKTFFIAAIMSMKHPRVVVYTGAMVALGLMTILSALLGNVITQIIPRSVTYYCSSFLFAIFGFKMLHEGWKMSVDEHGDDEFEEAKENINQVEESGGVDEEVVAGVSAANLNKQEIDLEAGTVIKETPILTTKELNSKDKTPDLSRKLITNLRKYVSPIFLQAFILTFLAEWGDRSQISTIILGARENIVGVIIGGTLGHGLCTGAAVIGGRMVAQHISIRTVTLVGAFVFLFFACSAFFIGPGDD